ncbi:MAG: nucleotidyl transferase AbiEii/AbiGii toxin family protein [Candidatus Daviesbacteria bacterium]|nr:nucleotidyl transferase AbiEii/AbiGii toxin family protein [Candidatus Daviesbacteria bacterium]
MYSLKDNSILLPHQITILQLFFASEFAKTFFFTGGTCLAAFYLAHRESQDLDFFSLSPFDSLVLRTTIQEIADKTNATMSIQARSQTYSEIYLENTKDRWRQKIDVVQEQPVHFGEITHVDNIAVDSLINITTNKILAVFGRLEPKDYIDLYMIFTQTELSFDEMFEKTKQKDTGLSELYFANVIADVGQFKTFPKMHTPFNREAFVKFYQDLSRNLLLKIKP